MKKKKLGYGLAILAVLIVVVLSIALLFRSAKNDNSEETSAPITEESYFSEITELEETENNVVEVGTIKNHQNNTDNHNNAKPVKPSKPEEKLIDGWLKIVSVGDYGGKLSFVIENASKNDIEYAIITCNAGKTKLTFKITALLSKKKALIVCNENFAYSEDATFTDWKIENKVVYPENKTVNKDVFSFNTMDGFIEIKNISNKNIKGNIYICYKKVDDDIYMGAQTYRVTVDGLKSGESKKVDANHFNKNMYEIIFVDYDK